MKKYIYIAIINIIFVLLPQISFASSGDINREEAFIFFSEVIGQDIPMSYQYIDLNFKNISPNSALETALKKLVYVDKIQNNTIYLSQNKTISRQEMVALSNAILGLDLTATINAGNTNMNDLKGIAQLYKKEKNGEEKQTLKIGSSFGRDDSSLSQKEKLLFDVYDTLQSSHYDRASFSEEQLLNAAIEGLAEGADDTYTSYFPPDDSSSFFENLDGEYEGIGAYVEMPNPGELNIVSPIAGGPAEAVGLEGGDRVIFVDGKEVSSETSLKEVISWIKGPANSYVELEVQRNGETLNFKIKRQKIILKDIEHKTIGSDTAYIQIKNFGNTVAEDFKEVITEIQADPKIKKIIIDVRNNPGGYLDQVGKMLGYFVPKGEPTAIVSYGVKENRIVSSGNTLLDLNNYKVVLLQSRGTASAAEIMNGTLKDYFPETMIVGDQSFGKGSVQSLKTYYDGSTLKYTTAKWYTGKSRTGIDGVGITPDIEIELDRERLKNFKKDNQLETALDL